MSKITSPPEVVESAKGASLGAALASLLTSAYSDQIAANAASRARDLADLLPHADKATLVVVVDYAAKFLMELVTKIESGTLPNDATAVLNASVAGLAHVIVELGNDMMDDIEADQKASADEALSDLREKLAGQVQPESADEKAAA